MIDKEFIQYYGQKFKVDLRVVLENQILGKDMSRLVGFQGVNCLFYLEIYICLFLISLSQGKVDPPSRHSQTLFYRHQLNMDNHYLYGQFSLFLGKL